MGKLGRAALLLLGAVGPGCTLLIGTSDLDPGGFEGDASADAVASEADVADGGSRADHDGDGEARDGAPPPDPALIGYWTFDETSGPIARDQSGRGRHAVLVGASVDPDGGVRGGAAVLDGDGEVRVDALAGAAFPASGTVSLWFKYTFPEDDPENRGIFDTWDRTRSHVFIRRRNGAPPREFQVALQPATDAGNYTWADSFTVSRDAWTHVVVTWDAVTRQGAVYVDRRLLKLSKYGEYPDFVPSEQELRLGRRFIGSIDEVRLYDRALAPVEVSTLR